MIKRLFIPERFGSHVSKVILVPKMILLWHLYEKKRPCLGCVCILCMYSVYSMYSMDSFHVFYVFIPILCIHSM